jgi:hypothetical protein
VNSPAYITQDEDDDETPPLINDGGREWTSENDMSSYGPSFNTRSKAKQYRHNVTTEAMLSVLELSTANISQQQLSSRKFPLQILCEFAGAVMDDETGDMLEYRQLIKRPKYRDTWSKAFGKEIGRLAQGLNGVVEGTNTLYFIPKSKIPPDRLKDVTYARICVNVRPDKADPYHCRITLGGNLVNYPGDVGTRRQTCSRSSSYSTV